jgi:hypothetical protein
MKKSVIRLLFTIVIFTVPATFNLTFAQIKTLDGIITNLANQPIKGVEVMLNTPSQEKDTTDENGYYHITTNDFPVSIQDQKKNFTNLKIWPNPAQENATITTSSLEGTIAAFNTPGQLLNKTNIKEGQELYLKGKGLTIIQYTDKEGKIQTGKILLQKEQTNIQIEQANTLKSSEIENTHNYKLTIKGTFNEQTIDTIIPIIEFYIGETNHTQDITLNNKPITLKGKTIIIGKNPDARNYSLDDQSYINNRAEGNMTFFITNNDGSFYQEITSDTNGNFQTTIPSKGNYIYGIQPNNKTHEALITIIADSITNNEVIGAMTKEASKKDNLWIHYTYDKDDTEGNRHTQQDHTWQEQATGKQPT